ncbi:MAG: hypothetical protein WCS08_04645 [Eubacteriales bacterium]
MTLNDLDDRLGKQLEKLEQNLELFSSLQEKTQGIVATYEKAEQGLRQLEAESKARLDQYDRQFNTILREVNMRIEDLSFLRNKLRDSQRDFTVFADKRIEDHKKEIAQRLAELEDQIEAINNDLGQLGDELDKVKVSIMTFKDPVKAFEKRLRRLYALLISSSFVFIVLIFILFKIK